MTFPISIRQLTEFDRSALERHFLGLRDEDRRLRFGVVLPDSALRGYVERIDFTRDAVFASIGDDLEIVAVAHLAHNGNDGELGVSVLSIGDVASAPRFSHVPTRVRATSGCACCSFIA